MLAENKQKNSIIARAVRYGTLEALKLVIGAIRTKHGDEKTAKLLNKKNKDGLTPLLCATSIGRLDKVKVLAKEKDCNLILEDKNGWTPFHYASGKSVEMMELLLSGTEKRHGESMAIRILNKANKKGETPLMRASGTSNPQLANVSFHLLIFKPLKPLTLPTVFGSAKM